MRAYWDIVRCMEIELIIFPKLIVDEYYLKFGKLMQKDRCFTKKNVLNIYGSTVNHLDIDIDVGEIFNAFI